MHPEEGFGMGLFDDIFNEDIIWVVLLLLLVFVLPQRCTEPIFKNKGKEENIECKKDIIYRRTRDQKERRRLVY